MWINQLTLQRVTNNWTWVGHGWNTGTRPCNTDSSKGWITRDPFSSWRAWTLFNITILNKITILNRADWGQFVISSEDTRLPFWIVQHIVDHVSGSKPSTLTPGALCVVRLRCAFALCFLVRPAVGMCVTLSLTFQCNYQYCYICYVPNYRQ